MKLFLSLIAIIYASSVSAQTIKVYKNNTLVARFINDDSNTYKVVLGKTNPQDNLLSGSFTVGPGKDKTLGTSDDKKVQFSNGNLYWDGSMFHIEASQNAYASTYNTDHISHFFWTNYSDYSSGNADYMPYAASYKYSTQSFSDTFWCGEANKLTVDGTDELYNLSKAEWDTIFNYRTNASSLFKCGVTVGDATNCLLIAPDNFNTSNWKTGSEANSYTLEEVNNLGLVCLPAAGARSNSSLSDAGSKGYYWTASPVDNIPSYAWSLIFQTAVSLNSSNLRSGGYTLRLVRNE